MPSRLRARLTTARRRALRLLAAGASFATIVALPASAEAAAGPAEAPDHFQEQVIFKASQDPGYACYRIPAVVRTVKGTLLAFAEGRTNDCSDAGDIDLVLKRSEDGGRTWGPLQIVNEGNGDTHGNPAPVVDKRTGRILLTETWNPGKPGGGNCDIPCNRTPHLQHSDDDGRTWSAPRDLSAQVLPASWNSWYATGPVHGVQLTKGRHAGRLVVGVNAESYANGRVTENHAALIHSDDGGDTWRVGATDTWPIAEDGTFRQKPSELTLTERGDGSVYVSGREQDGTDLGHRSYAVSRDGGDSFVSPFRTQPELYTPQVQGAVLRLGDRMLLSAPADPDRRRTMMIRSSYDGGGTWDSAEEGTVVTTDWSGYSDLTHAGEDSVGLMYEGGTVDARDEIRFARFGIGWLSDRGRPAPTTSDLAPGARRATVVGDPRPGDGRFGKSLAFDGNDGVRLPYRSELPLGTADFTAAVWFRHGESSGELPMFWIGGVGSTQPQVWLRAEPASQRIRALMTVRDGAAPPRSASVSSKSAYNDNAWHLAVVRRGGGTLTLFVDGTAVATSAAPAGSVSRNSPFGIHVGQRIDGRSHFTGSLDNMQLHRRALTDAEVRELTTSETVGGTAPLVRLPLDHVTGRPSGGSPARLPR